MKVVDLRVWMYAPFLIGGIVGVASLLNEKLFGIGMRFERHWSRVYFSAEHVAIDFVNNWWSLSPSPLEVVGGAALVLVLGWTLFLGIHSEEERYM